MARIKIPPQNVPPTEEGSPFVPAWYDILKQVDGLQPLSDITFPVGTTIDGVTGAFTLGYGLSRSALSLRAGLTTTATGILGADVALGTGAYVDGPKATLGTGLWFVTGNVELIDTSVLANIFCKMWDGTTVIASASERVQNTAGGVSVTMSGFITNPAGDVRISCISSAGTSKILFNQSGNSKDSMINAVRLA